MFSIALGRVAVGRFKFSPRSQIIGFCTIGLQMTWVQEKTIFFRTFRHIDSYRASCSVFQNHIEAPNSVFYLSLPSSDLYLSCPLFFRIFISCSFTLFLQKDIPTTATYGALHSDYRYIWSTTFVTVTSVSNTVLYITFLVAFLMLLSHFIEFGGSVVFS